MTRFDPNLSIRRMVIEREGHSVYDEHFHTGVNIIRGENSSGKSSILNFIQYGLGGDVSEWSETALLCDRVFIEAHLSGKVATLSRIVSEDGMQPMDIFFGSYNEARTADRAQWDRYPYRRSSTKESFSQVIFRLLEIPEAANEDSGNITIHQVLRLLYADQLSPIDALFAHEGFDNTKIRDAVGRLLCGAFDNELYSNQLEIRSVDKQFNVASAELSSLYRALGQAGHDLTSAWVAEQRARNESERESVNEEVTRLRRDFSAEGAKPTLKAQQSAYDSLIECQKKVGALCKERDALVFAIEDSATFTKSLEEKLESLKDASLVSEILGGAQFATCPACYAELGQSDPDVCALCKEPYDSEIAKDRLGGLINETALQLRQSRLLQEDRSVHLSEVEHALETAESEWSLAASKYSEVQRRPTNEQEYRLGELFKRLGYLDRREEDLAEKAKMMEVINTLTSRKAELNERLSFLRDRNEQLIQLQQSRLRDAYLQISDETRTLLSRDLKRQDSFEDPKKVDFSFTDDQITVDGHSYFSASSRAILKSAFIFGFQAAASKHTFFRHPRFVMLDTIEDKGMEAARSQNFQCLIVETSESSSSQNQIIFATAMIDESLNNDNYVVGRFYTRENRSLDIC